MMRILVVVFALLTAFAAVAQEQHDHDHDDHVSELAGFRAVHAWARATGSNSALIFMELENGSAAPVTISGGESTMAASARLVGFALKNGREVWQDIPGVPIKPGHALHLEPHGLALLLGGLSTQLKEGDELKARLHTSLGDLDLHVEIEGANATHHSHAGHSH
ncbi:copper chaperone PCu(A)C [Cohaesibacter haloalkalitolerans]|uniref:copper chaperone PCu(A)C n=1 Tax=Cohaesibacter haloalkalitolerans TaxID=1162980 RepID=UPI000E64E9E7|nr:copper chaperone PCu(A)C [Cohaesibacter haloalkalitolerans]